MHIVGMELRSILAAQDSAVEVHTSTRKLVARVSPMEALKITSSGRFAGVGNHRRIHHIKPDNSGLGSVMRAVEKVRFKYGDKKTLSAIAAFDHRPTRFVGPVPSDTAPFRYSPN
jgi:hypothetical protein